MSSNNVTSRSTAKYGTHKKAGRKKLKIFFGIIGSLLILLLLGVGIIFALTQKTFDEVETVSFHTPIEDSSSKPLPRPAESDSNAINILLLGSDSRNSTDRGLAGDEMRGYRSDAIMVAQISPDREHITIMSIMRDNWVEIEGHGEAKINAAFSYGGIPLAVNTIENFIGTRIDHGAIVDFQSFKGLTDALGGVTVNNTVAFQPHHKKGSFFEQGPLELDGEDALAFVRERYSFIDGDYQRVRNQQAYMKGLTNKLLSKETLTDPKKLGATFEALKPFLIIDEELSLTRMIGIGTSLKDIRMGDVTFFTSPTYGVSRSSDGQSIILPNFDELEIVRKHFTDGTLHEYDPIAES
ncbi:MAG TPA: LCP family protein [Microbacteriaceae bacterium]|nr:LCP family protein [Microbacteriaceae bacterium]